MKTNREIFDTVKAHLLQQDDRAFDPDSGACRYRDQKGRKCAVGCVIPDELYNPLMEGATIVSIELNTRSSWREAEPGNGRWGALCAALDAAGIPTSARGLLTALQSAHDDERNWDNGKEGLILELDRIERTYVGEES